MTCTLTFRRQCIEGTPGYLVKVRDAAGRVLAEAWSAGNRHDAQDTAAWLVAVPVFPHKKPAAYRMVNYLNRCRGSGSDLAVCLGHGYTT